ncbi:DUF885 domain-containing protein [Aliidiomarina soli]|uniref:DUF885 domain-containing protein n=1 Tax=Aliidiomarina soli TaxID=1928574 RepID=A0A432WLX0_9GAMM|nr:DUF885 domain-containing protein [Aliidiomarina soli]RUO34754.1 DUF885 domain-containing protein [Aliidiomarina soli]
MKYSILKVALVAALSLGVASACSQAENPSAQQQSEQKSAYLETIYAEYFTANLQLNPLQATFVGEHRFNDKLANSLSEEHRTRQRMLEEEYLSLVREIDPDDLAEQDRLSYEIFKRDRETTLEQLEHPTHLLPVDQFYNIAGRFAMLGSGQSAQPFNSVEDYQNWAARLRRIPTIFDQAISNMEQGIERDIVQPRILMEKALPQIDAHVVDDLEDSMFFAPLQEFPSDFSDEQKQELSAQYQQILTDEVLPAYQRLADFIRTTYLEHTRADSFGLGALPGGEEWYDFNVRWRTTTDLSANEIHQIGLDEVTRIHGEIEDIMQRVEFEGSLQEFFDFTQSDEQFIYASRDAMLEDYRTFAAQVDEVTPQLFHQDMFPQADYEIRKVEEFREQSASSGSYQAPPEDGSRAGIFYLNTYDLSARPTWAKGALVLHEAAPGHHYQIALQREMENLPRFRRFGGETAFIEGWGLYAESLGNELGVYNDYDQFGALVAELWRSIRLVVDTGIHAKGWSRDEVLDYMRSNAPVADARAISEAERFMALPGQALAYKIGQLEIRKLRTEAEQALGDSFNVRDFHREVLRNGSLPLSVLRQQIERWVADQQA